MFASLSSLLKTVNYKSRILDLLDIFVEADRLVDFTRFFTHSGTKEIRSREAIRPLILLDLFGEGTNLGIKRIANANQRYSYDELLYVRKYFPAWNQNLMAEWRTRYEGYVVKVYWHVETNAVSIYSQLKSYSASEAAAMIEGLIRHDTEMRVEKNFVDSHGQSEVAFAFCRLLNEFKLMPRLKRIKREKLYLPDSGMAKEFPNLTGVLTRPIRWEKVNQQYARFAR